MKRQISTVIFASLCCSLFFACGQRQTEEELLKQAEAFEKSGEHKEALHALEKLAHDYPDGENADEALHRAAFLYYNNINDFQKSIELHREIVKRYPDSGHIPQARFMVGFIYANDLKDYDNAKAAYDEFLEKHPDSELVESVKWELDHLGEDVNEQMKDMFGDGESGGNTMVN